MVRTLADIVDERCREEENCDTETFCHIVMKPNVGKLYLPAPDIFQLLEYFCIKSLI